MIEEFKKAVSKFDGTALPIAVADIEFSFPEDTLYPNLCCQTEKYGLISPLQGRTVATLPEIHLALRQNATIKYIDAYVYPSEDNFVFRHHLKGLIDARNKAKQEGNELMQQLLKLYVNTLYGKIAQGLNPKKGYNLFEGKPKTIGQSPISQPFFASMITGTLRAGLSALLVALDELNKCGHNYQAISATTDGMLYRISDKTGIAFKDCLKPEYQNNIPSSLLSNNSIFKTFEEVDPVLYNKLQEFAVLRLLQASRKAWGYDEYIEIKHACNMVVNIKTRGQIGAYDVK
jgi:hypothetical protein